MRNIVTEFKYRRVTRPMVDQIFATAFRHKLTPPSDIVIICRSATATAYTAAKQYQEEHGINVHIVPSLVGYEEE